MNQQLRVILAIVVSVVIWIAWQTFFMEPPKAPGAADAGAPVATAPTGAPSPGPAGPGLAEPGKPMPGTPAPGPAPAAEPEPDKPEQRTAVSTPLWDAEFSTRGGALASFLLKGDKETGRPVDGKREPMQLAHPGEGQPLPLSLEVGGAGAGFDPQAPWRLVSRGEGELVYERERGGLAVTKRFTWKPDSYVVGLDVSVRRAEGAAALPVPLSLLYPGFETPKSGGGGLFSLQPVPEIQQAVCLPPGKRSVETYTFDKDKAQVSFQGVPQFAGIDRKYFLAAIMPLKAEGASVQGCALSGTRPGALQAALVGTVTPAPGAAAEVSYAAYLGPKDVDRLAVAGHGLENSVDFGFFAVICRPLLWIMKVSHGLLRNWGLAIVALTLLVKALTFPLTHKQMKSMEEMRRLAPKLEEIKKRYAGDQQRINLESMKLYKEHNVQPLGGCLPMLVQMPVWFALYATLSASWELYNAPFIPGWINDLTAIDPYYVLPVLMTATMLLSQVLTPQPQATQQQKFLTWGMPLIFGVMMLALPSGLVLYIFTNNILSIGQSLWFRRKFGVGAEAAAAKGTK